MQYLKGDVTQPVGDGPKFLVHVCNNRGGWGGKASVVKAISRRWKAPENAYREWATVRDSEVWGLFCLGSVQFVPVGDNLTVVNMVAQDGYASSTRPRPLSYSALQECLGHVAKAARGGTSIHMPRIGVGLAGGRWETVAGIIERSLGDIPVFVYDLG